MPETNHVGYGLFLTTVKKVHQRAGAKAQLLVASIEEISYITRFVFYRENANVSTEHVLQHQNSRAVARQRT